uniref:MSP domain-containing protein n=1 Tax=Periophthalmus magnuspinnatus TaxID=409849 RepID=A0A3B4ALH3_9GOBI
MDRAEEVLLVEPRDPFPDLVTAKLRLTNSSDCSMYFKVVITSPSRLCVWPYSAWLTSWYFLNMANSFTIFTHLSA